MTRYKFDTRSASTVRLQLFLKGHEIDSGTGFFYQAGEQLYLVTCWHVLTGRIPEAPLKTRPNIPDSPDRLVFHYLNKTNRIVDSVEMNLYDEYHHPIWLQPAASSLIDLAFIKLDIDLTAVFCINIRYEKQIVFPKSNLGKVKLPDSYLRIGEDVFILGFPEFYEKSNLFPIWKKGSVASEPIFQIDSMDKLYIDATTRSGMSGGPVLLDKSIAATRQSTIILGGPHFEFIGVYSAHLDGTEHLPEIGIIWKDSYINVDCAQKGVNPAISATG